MLKSLRRVHIMRNFGSGFGGQYAGIIGIHLTVDLGRIFWSMDKIALAARRFVKCDPAQIKKTVVRAGEAVQPAIPIAWTRRDAAEIVMSEILERLGHRISSPVHLSFSMVGLVSREVV